MFPSASPKKRKHHEYHDPDYPGAAESEEEQPTTSKRAALERNHPTSKTTTTTPQNTNQPSKDDVAAVAIPSERLAAIITREFQREAALKEQQLEQIDERLAQSRQLLERLRYGIVAEYYQKQELPLTSSDVSALRQTTLQPSTTTTKSEADNNTPQMPLHPSIKKIIGKKPRSYEELLRACPKRAAAQTAKDTIRAKSQAQRREERRLIREQGIVIDHEKQQQQQLDQAAVKQEQPLAEVALKRLLPPPQLQSVGKALNAARLNNKRKHLVVIGNTSKYIGGGADDAGGMVGSSLAPSLPASHNQRTPLSHKWLVYVQAKEETTLPLQSFIKKVRFFLHASYRPNDVVDVCTPPFQIARRGWGEFPMRIQLFFHERLQQKPVQLVHQLVLDKTQSGLHTLGAETLVEVWLRIDNEATTTAAAAVEKAMKPASPQKKAIEAKISSTKIETITNHQSQQQQQHQPQQQHQTVAAVHTAAPNAPKPRLISYTQNKEELDDNLFEFLNNISGTPSAFCGDIEKIQPTVLVSEAEVLTHIPTLMAPPPQLPIMMMTTASATIGSPRKLVAPQHVSKVQTMTLATTSAAAASKKLEHTPLPTNGPVSAAVAAVKKLENAPSQSCGASSVTAPKVGVFNVTLPATTPATTTPISNFKGLRIVGNNNNNNNRKTIILQGAKSGIPLATTPNGFAAPLSSQQQQPPPPKKILQKKLVQLVDADGKIKYLQMLVATSPAAAATATAPANAKNTFVLPAGGRAAKMVSTAASSAAISANTVPAPAITKKAVNLATSINAKTQAATTPTKGIMTIAAAAKPKATPQSNAAAISILSTLPAAIKTMQTTPKLTTLKATPHQQPQATRNVVFQKEGKLYIIDPQQMKLRQQQKKQFSLLKPQVSLLKQQQRPPEPATPKSTVAAVPLTPSSVACDHNYAPPPPLPPAPKSSSPPPAIFRKPLVPAAVAAPIAPAVHLGMRETRVATLNAFEQLQQQRQAFEQQFSSASFGEMRTATEFLLRRLPLVLPATRAAEATTTASAYFGWCSNTPQEFEALPALKQRACEWLRAKYICSCLRKHKDLQQLAATTDAYWSTREICTFARWHAYTPALKALQTPLSGGGDKQKQPSPQTTDAGAAPFNALVKSELELQPSLLACDTLTTQSRLRTCVDGLWQRLQQHEVDASAAELIDVVGGDCNSAKEKSTKTSTVISRMQPLDGDHPVLYLPPPPGPLTVAAELVGDICREQRVRLSAEAVRGDDKEGDDVVEVVQPLAQTLLAQCLRMFVEKLLRQSLAAKVQHSAAACCSSSSSTNTSSAICGAAGSEVLLSAQDIGRVLALSADFDFLTNCHFGIVAKGGEEGGTASPTKRV